MRRIVHTSSVATLAPRADGTPVDERAVAKLDDVIGDYKRSKLLAEREVDAAWARGLPVVVVSPSTPVGDGDIKPTPTGKIIVDFLAGRLPAYVDTGLNLIDVRDVAAGHLLAAERGRPGERYILANANVTLKELLAMLARIAGRAAPRLRLPHWVPLALAHMEAPIARLLGRAPRVPARRRSHGEETACSSTAARPCASWDCRRARSNPPCGGRSSGSCPTATPRGRRGAACLRARAVARRSGEHVGAGAHALAQRRGAGARPKAARRAGPRAARAGSRRRRRGSG